MAKFVLNTRSGLLHNEDHGGDSENTMDFNRIDAADLFVHRELRSKLEFCRQCFPSHAVSTNEEPVFVETTAPEALPKYEDMLNIDNQKDDKIDK